MAKPEQKLQIQVANYLFLMHPDMLWTISPASMISNPRAAYLSNRMGYRKGTPDLLIFEPRGVFHGLFIELKWGKNATSTEQDAFLAQAVDRKYATAVCWAYQEAIGTVENYLNQKEKV